MGKRRDAAGIVLRGLKALEYRGYDSWGVAVAVNDSRVMVKKQVGQIGRATASDLGVGKAAFGHTRWATHGGVSEANAHPLLDCTGNLALIHNGIIENYEDLKAGLVRAGHRFVSQTDSEVAVHLIEKQVQRMGLEEAVRTAFAQMEGLNAFVVLDARKRKFVAVRNGSPLVVGLGQDGNYVASDAVAFLPYTRRAVFLEDGQMAVVEEGGVEIFDAGSGRPMSLPETLVDWSLTETRRGRYPHFMLKEIYEQPRVLTQIASDSPGLAVELVRVINRCREVYMVACGSAAYAAMAGAYIFSKVARRHVNWVVGSEFGYQLEFLTAKSLIMALSQSGETMDTLESVKKARLKGAKIAALVNVLGSTLYREADYKTLIGAGPEKAVASTKAFVGKLAHLILLGFALAGGVHEGRKLLERARRSAAKVLAPASVRKIRRVAGWLKNAEHIYVVGRGLSYPASLEMALKIKEVSYIHAEGMAAGELKHGSLALVTKGTPCIAILPDDETYGATLAGAMEMKARGGVILGISHKPHEVFDYYLPVLDAGVATIIPNVVVGQVLAYYLAVGRGLDPDKPRNLAKSVTVK